MVNVKDGESIEKKILEEILGSISLKALLSPWPEDPKGLCL